MKSLPLISTAFAGFVLAFGLVGCLSGNGTGASSTPQDGGGPDAPAGAPIVSVSSGSQGFGSVTLGAQSTPTSIVVTNTGNAPTGLLTASIGGPNAANFVLDTDQCSGTALQPALSCTITLHFAPTVAGIDTATLTVNATPGGSVSVPLTGTAETPGAVAVAPSSNDFGPIVVGTTSSPQTFTLTNSGQSPAGPLSAALGGTDSGQFAVASDTCTGQTLAAGGTCTVGVAFAPSAAGSKAASLSVTGAPGGAANATLAGTALTGGALAVAGTTDAFASTTVGATSSPLTFTVTNTGQGSTGTVSTALGGANAAEFKIASSTCAAVLAPGANCTVTVTFDPASAGPKTATLGAVASPGGSAGVSLTATGIAQAALSSTSTTQSFGSIVLGQTSTDALFTLQNTGGVPSGALTTAISGTNAADFKVDAAKTTCKATPLAAGAGCVVAATFTPSTANTESATLTVSGTPGGSVPIALSGTGLTPGALKVAPASFAFAATLLGDKTASETFTVSNSGQSATGTLATSLTGSGAGEFEITSDTCNTKTLDAAGTCKVAVAFDPTASGGASATLLVTATGAGGSVSASVSGTGQAPAQLAWGAASYACGSTATKTTTSTTLTLDNQGDIAATAPTFAASGTNGGDFTVASSTCTGGIAARSSCTVRVTFDPSTATGESATLTATSSTGGSAATALTGTGEVPAALSLTPSSFAFSPTVKGATGNTQTFTLTNTGGVPAGNTTAVALAVTGANKGDFVLSQNTCPATLNAAGTCSVQVTFTPSTAAAEGASLGASATPGGTATSSLTGTGLTPGALSVSATSFAFPNVVDGAQSAEQTFTVTNTGAGTTSALTASINASATSPFVIDPGTTTCQGAALAGGKTCVVSVYFAPTATGPQSATLAVTASGNGSTSTALTGTGLSPAALTLAAANTSFGSYVEGATSAPVTFTVTNTGTQATGAPITVDVTGTNKGDFILVGTPACLTNGIAGNDTCAFSLQFKPSIVGGETASVAVTASPGGTSPALALSGTGLSPAALKLSATSYDFGGLVEKSKSADEVFTVTNSGQGTTAALTTSVTAGTGFALDTANSTCAGATLAGGGTCKVAVYFEPTSAGPLGATLSVAAAGTGTITATLSGTGLTPAALSLAAASTSFGSSIDGTPTSTPVNLTITNTGTQTTGKVAVNVTGANAGDFTLVGAPACLSGVVAGTPCVVQLQFTPSIVGLESASVSVSATPGGTSAAIAVTGTGYSTGPELSLDPAVFSFGTVVGDGATENFTLTNVGGAVTGTLVETLNFTAPFSVLNDNCYESTLASGASCEISIEFNATTSTVGTLYSGSLGISEPIGTLDSVTSSFSATKGSGTPLNVTSTGTLSVFGCSDTDGGIYVTASEVFTVTNNGTSASGPLAITADPSPPGQFMLVPGYDTCTGTSLAPSASCTFQMHYEVSQTSCGGADSIVRIVSSGGAEVSIGIGAASG